MRHAKLRARFLLLLALAGLPSSSSRADECHLADLVNYNIKGKVEDYRQFTFRSLHSLSGMFGFDFETAVAGLRPGALVFDSGGAYSLYGLELARRGSHVVSVDVHDYYRDVLYPLADPLRAMDAIAGAAAPQRLELFGKVPVPVLNALSRQLDIPLPRSIAKAGPGEWEITEGTTSAQLAKEVATFVAEAKSRLEALGKRFDRRQGLVQRVLAEQADDSIDLFVDAFGGFHYSSHRTEFLAVLLRKLRQGGVAYLNTIQLEDTLAIGDGKPGNLFEQLQSLFPRTFQLVKVDDRRVLRVTSKDREVVLAYLAQLQPRVSELHLSDGNTIPKMEYSGPARRPQRLWRRALHLPVPP